MTIYDEPNGEKLVVWKQGATEMQIYLSPVKGGYRRAGRQMMINSNGAYDKDIPSEFITNAQARAWYGFETEEIT